MLELSCRVADPRGLHARTCVALASVAADFSCKATLSFADATVSASDLMGLMALEAGSGDEVIVRCAGRDEAEAARAIRHVLASGMTGGQPTL